MKNVIVYGANGFTGQLICDRLASLPIKLTIAGRNESKIIPLAKKHNAQALVFSGQDEQQAKEFLKGFDLLINCAGPFKKTAIPMAKAAIENGCHYFDISGELKTFQALYAMNKEAASKKVALIPGVGFDIAPSDCLAALLAKKINNPKSLSLVVIPGNTRPSHGTVKTALSSISTKALVRKNNHLCEYTGTKLPQKISVKNKDYYCIRQNLPDLLCAHISTGIKDIDTFLSVPKSAQKLMKFVPLLQKITATPLGEKIIFKGVDLMAAGPNEEQKQNSRALVYGEVKNDTETMCGILESYEPYVYTADIILAATKIYLERGLAPGFHTPSSAFGASFAIDVDPSKISAEYYSSKR